MHRFGAVAVSLPLLMFVGVGTAAPAPARDYVVKRTLERQLSRAMKSEAGVSVRFKCPERVQWVKGSNFYCKGRSAAGYRVRIRVHLGSPRKGVLRWRVVA